MIEIFERVSPKIRRSKVILDLGAGIRPQPFFQAERHICSDPHHEYHEWLTEHHFEAWLLTALEALIKTERVESIFMLDVIEHMDKEVGEKVRDLSITKADQVVIYTPMGFKEQKYIEGEKDAWGMNGTYWQTHRSGWTPEDFRDWDITLGGQSFFAIWNPIPA